MVKPWAPEMADSPFAADDHGYEARVWRKSALYREWDQRQADGTFGAFTDDEMEHARDTLSDGQPIHDPVAEILGLDEEDRSNPWLATGPVTDPWMLPDAVHLGGIISVVPVVPIRPAPLLVRDLMPSVSVSSKPISYFTPVQQAAVDQVCRDVAAALTTTLQEVADGLHRAMVGADVSPLLQGIPSEPAEKVGRLNRIRHGRGAVCPRHGETRGGTCMKCLRTGT